MAFTPVLEKTQTQLLLDWFRANSSISALEAQGTLLIRSLSRRINDLEAMGYSFHRELKRDSRGQRYTRYHFTGLKRTAVGGHYKFGAQAA